MIALLRGRVVAAAPGVAVLDVHGVGYRVHVPVGAIAGRLGEEVALHTHLAVREDALTLYGFGTPQDRDLFETLITVTGVGPKLALAALSALGADGLRRAVVAEDVAALTVIPGVGRKGAQRMVLDLRDKIGAGAGDTVPGGPLSAQLGPRGEVRAALDALGYGPAEVVAALDALGAHDVTGADEDAGTEELLRLALRTLAKAR